MGTHRVEEHADSVNMMMKEEHTIIDKWPLSLKKRYGSPGAKDEFRELMALGHVGTDRYVEWRLRS